MSNQFPTTLNNWQLDETIEEGWANSIEEKIGVDNSTDTDSFDYRIRQLENEVNEEAVTRVNETTYELDYAPVVATVKLFLDGFRLQRGVDYSLGGIGNKTVTFLGGRTVDAGSVVLADYKKVLS